MAYFSDPIGLGAPKLLFGSSGFSWFWNLAIRSLTACEPDDKLLVGMPPGPNWPDVVELPIELLLTFTLVLRELPEEALPLELPFFCRAAIRSERDVVPAGRFAGRRGCWSDLISGERAAWEGGYDERGKGEVERGFCAE